MRRLVVGGAVGAVDRSFMAMRGVSVADLILTLFTQTTLPGARLARSRGPRLAMSNSCSVTPSERKHLSAAAAKEFEPRTHSFASTERVEPTCSHLRKREKSSRKPVESVVQAGGPAGKMGAGCRGCWPKRTGAGAAPIAGFAPKAGVALNNPAGAGAGVVPLKNDPARAGVADRPKAARAASTFA